MREDENSNLADKLTSGETEGPINNKEIMCTTESPELKANSSEKKKSLLNAQMGETDNTVISDTNDHCYKTDSKEETNQTLEQMERSNNTSLDEEQTYTVDGHMASNQELNDKTDHLQEYRGKKEKLMDISATEITLNGTTVNLSPDSGNWTYKE